MEHGVSALVEILCGEKSRIVSAKTGMTLADVLISAGHAPNLPCGGKGVCRKCVVNASGKLSAITQAERQRFSQAELDDGRRLACQALLEGDVRVISDMPEEFGHILLDGEDDKPALRPIYSKFGVAVDIGTTTLCARICDTQGGSYSIARKNPQAAFGADVISRIEAAIGGKGQELAAGVRAAIYEMLTELAETRGICVSDIDGLVLTGNTTMLYLLTEHNPKPLSHAPFEADRLFGEFVQAQSLLIDIASDARLYLPRCMSAFVGADITAAVLASGMCRHDETSLLVDVGTNGELALWHEGRLFCCSTAAGPAFEGGGITNGTYGVKGAIDRVWQDKGQLKYSTIGEASPIGVCGSGIVDAVAAMLKAGIVDETGAFIPESGKIELGGIEINSRDIRAVQLAKGSVRAGIETLLQYADINKCEVDKLYIAGGFGNYLDLKNAAAIGLIPPELLPRAISIGNAALTGAQMLLQNETLVEESEKITDSAETVALDSNPVFMDNYMLYMTFEET